MLNKLLNLLLMLFGFTQATKLAPPTNSPAVSAPPADTAPAAPSAPAPVAELAIDSRFAWEKPIRSFKAIPQQPRGYGMGYRSHTVDQFKLGVSELNADFREAVTETVRQLDRTLLELKKAINECGDMTPTHKANLLLDLEQLTTDRAYWDEQLTLTQSDPKSEFTPSYEQFRVGYEAGMQRYHEDKRFGDANGLNNLIP